MNLNPVATGNKTTSGAIGTIIISLLMPVVFKYFNIEDTNGQITVWVLSVVPTVGLALVGLGHKIVRAGGLVPWVKSLWSKYIV